MFKQKAIKGLICLVAIGVFASTGWAMGKKPAESEQLLVSSEQKEIESTGVQPEGESKPAKVEVAEQKGTQTSEAQAIEPKPVMEYKLPEGEEIVDVIFGEAEMTVEEAMALGIKGLEQKKATETVKVQYPKVITIKDMNIKGDVSIKSIRFLNEKGEMKSEYQVKGQREWTGVMVSKNKKYLNVHSIINYEKEEAESIMLNDEGKVLWSVKHNLFEVYPSPNGKYLVGLPTIEWSDAPIYVYNEKGLVREIKKDDLSCRLSFSKDGSYFAVTLTTRIEGEDRADLIVFDGEGNELWRKNGITRGIAADYCPINITDDDIITVMTGGDEYKIYHFDKKGNLVKEEQGNLELLRQFNPDYSRAR
ncbi:MAG: hypothetical protein QME40_01265 [bacterium]|nr:hypothetical protein [bacterium]